jgi:hypothetical protein
VASPLQLTEHWSVQVTWHVDPAAQVTLPLAPTDTVHVEPLPQSMLHDSPHEPSQTLLLAQSSEQLPEPQLLCEKSHVDPLAQLQLVPEQVGAFAPSSSPQPMKRRKGRQRRVTARIPTAYHRPEARFRLVTSTGRGSPGSRRSSRKKAERSFLPERPAFL